MGVKSGGEGHNLRNCHLGGGADAGHSLCKFHDEWLGGGTVLREVVDRGADFEHGVADAIHLLHTEDVGEFGDSLCRSSPRSTSATLIIEAASTYSLTEATVVAEATALPGEKVQLLAGKTCVHAL